MNMEFNENEKPVFAGEILLCEDNEINRHVIRSHLVRIGFKVVVAEDGKEGSEIVLNRLQKGEKPFDLIFMDIQMPVMDGIEAADIIKKADIASPVIALTASDSPADRELYASHGMPRCLNKPFTTEELWTCLYEYFTPVSRERVSEDEQLTEEAKQRKKLFTGFVRKNQTTYRDICAAVESGDIKLAHRMAHTVRGLAGLMDKAELREAARVVENALAGGDAGSLGNDSLEILGRELAKVLSELAPYLEEHEPEAARTDFDKDKARELFGKLEQLLRADSANCRNFLDALRLFPGTAVLISRIEEYEFEAALEALEELRQHLEV